MSFKQNALAWKQSLSFPGIPSGGCNLTQDIWFSRNDWSWPAWNGPRNQQQSQFFGGYPLQLPKTLLTVLDCADPRIFWSFCFGTSHSPGQSVVANPKSQAEFLSFFRAKRLTLKQYLWDIIDISTIWDSTLLPFAFETCSWSFQPDVPSAPKSKAVTNLEFARNQSLCSR